VRKVESSIKGKKVLHTPILALKHFDQYLAPKSSGFTIETNDEEDTLEDEFEERLSPIMFRILQESPESMILESELRTKFVMLVFVFSCFD
jgi:hypothetical protein